MPSLLVRDAEAAEMGSLMALYRAARSPELPAPSVVSIAAAIEDLSMLVVCDEEGRYVAATARFDFSPKNAVGWVGELSGTFVVPEWRGLGLQRLLLDVRLLKYAVNDLPVPGRTATLISLVHRNNEPSRRNLLDCGFVDLVEIPDWFTYEEDVWHGGDARAEWAYMVAGDEAVRGAERRVRGLGLVGGEGLLRRRDGTRTATVRVKADDIVMGSEQLAAIGRGDPALLGPPPAELRLLAAAAGVVEGFD